MLQTATQSRRLSFQQKRLWLQQRGTEVFRAQVTLRLDGPVDAGRLRDALRQVAARHEILRTVYRRLPGMKVPNQTVRAELDPAWREVDLAGDGAAVEQLLAEEGKVLYDYAAGPLLRATLARRSADRHFLILALPALCADARSLANLVRELPAGYAGTPLDGEVLQYGQLTDWQASLENDEDAEEGISFWRRHLAAAPPAAPLPLVRRDAARGAIESVPVAVGADLAGALRAAAAACEVSLESVLLAVWTTVLWRVSGEPDVVVGTELPGRHFEAMEAALGFYGKTVPLQAHLRPDLRFQELAGQLEAQRGEADDWLDFFEAAVEQGSLEFPLGFRFEEGMAPLSYGGLSWTVESRSSRSEPFGVAFEVQDGAEPHALLAFDTGVYRRPDMEILAERLSRVLRGAAADVASPLGSLDVLGEDERRRLAAGLGRPCIDAPARCLHELFEEQAALRPDRRAVVVGGEERTYGELEAEANRLARHLRSLGVGQESRVGILAGRSLEMVVGLLAVLKSGGAYVPIDPALPMERQTFLLEAVGASLVLAQDSLAERVHGLAIPVVRFGADARIRGTAIAAERIEPLGRVTTPESLAYVLFTSGSTGLPKPVGVEHRQIVHYTRSVLEALDLGSEAAEVSFAMVSTFAADLGNTSLFPALASGGRLHVFSQEQATDPAALAAEFQRHEIDVLKIVPSHLRALLSADGSLDPLPRRRLVLGGEALPWELAAGLQERNPDCLVMNHYGPTETTVGVLTRRLAPQAEPGITATVPIGEPLAGGRVYVTDPDLGLVPTGAPGELLIGGAGVSRGYLGQPVQTAERFIPDPFGGEPGARLYRTGDLARCLPEGGIEFLGRIDHQIKLHGFRLEPGEIEAVLARHPGVRESVVVAREDEPGRKQLVAYLVARQASVAEGELRSRLEAKLPQYMIPAVFVWLDALPRTANGKLDRKALPAPALAGSLRPRAEYVAPRSRVEEVLAEIWAQVLGVERVGVYDNFLQLGGDSILGIQVVARVNQAGFRLTPRQILEHQTIAELAQVAGFSEPVRAEQGVVTGAVPLTPIQRRFLDADPVDPHHFNQSLLLETSRPLDPVHLRRALYHLLLHHDALRLRFPRQGADRLQAIAPPDDQVPFAVIDLSALSAERRPDPLQAATAALQGSLELERGPLVRGALFDLGPSESQRLLLVVHHLAIDGVSWRVLLEDLERAHEESRRGATVSLPPKTTSFKEWAVRLADFAHWEIVEREAAYWLAATRREPGRLAPELPDGVNTVASLRMVKVSFGADETRALLEEVAPTYQADFDQVLISALAQTLARATGSRRVLIDLEGHGREGLFDDVDVSRTVGWFTAVYPAFLDLGGAFGPGEVLAAVREQLLKIPHKGIGYGLLRYLQRSDSEIARRLRDMPRAEVGFNYLGQLDRALPGSSPFRVAREYTGNPRSPRALRNHLIYVDCSISNGRLEVNWNYSRNLFRHETILPLAEQLLADLRALIEQSRSVGTGSLRPADFPQAEISPEDLQKVLSRLQSGGTAE